MKNIHLIPTNESSNLWITKFSNLLLCNDTKPIKEELGKNVFIYITSSENLKDGDYCLSKLNEVVIFDKKFTPSLYKKIVLTTNQDLIKNGVQAINEEFLEWFIKNQNCETVELIIEDMFDKTYGEIEGDYYKTIIPGKEDTDFLGRDSVDLQKQEAIEEEMEEDITFNSPELEKASREYSKHMSKETKLYRKVAFEDGANWQAERMYSGKEVESLLHRFMQSRHPDWHGYSTTKWFEQFKK